MRICFIVEGSYPYVTGGVSSWVHNMIGVFPNIEFILITIVSSRNMDRKFLYELPSNLKEIHEVYLQEEEYTQSSKRGKRYHSKEKKALSSLLHGDRVDWDTIFSIFSKDNISLDELLMSPTFYEVVKTYYLNTYHTINFSDFLWTMRSIYLPLFLALKFKAPQADIYHAVSTGYAGLIGAKAVSEYKRARFILSEHGIYSREREEELIKAKWVRGTYKSIWIDQFKKMSICAYSYAHIVTCLYHHAKTLQIELGCLEDKIKITPNGIRMETFGNISEKEPQITSVHIGAILRITPIKDVKTMIHAFYYASKINNNLKLFLMGPEDEDMEYAKECKELIQTLNVKNIIITGRINTLEYIGKMDMTILTSISEGQPLSILESFAAKKPCIATNVGNCQGLIYGEEDDFGAAGIVVGVMNILEIAQAILHLAEHKKLAKEMGERGYKRVENKYQSHHMEEEYRVMYETIRYTT